RGMNRRRHQRPEAAEWFSSNLTSRPGLHADRGLGITGREVALPRLRGRRPAPAAYPPPLSPRAPRNVDRRAGDRTTNWPRESGPHSTPWQVRAADTGALARARPRRRVAI